MIEYPSKLNIIFDKLNKNGIKPIIIGGYVRDFLLKTSSKDIDIELYGISSLKKLEEILKEFGKVNNVGKSFGVCKITFDDLDLDFSLPREDNKISPGHCGFDINTNSKLDFKTATSRRDFTINAIGYDVIDKKILDPFNGIKDLKNKILRAVNISKFDEDPLRVLRAVQFSSRFNFKLDDKLLFKCKSMIENSLLDELPRERVFQEIKKLLLKSKAPSTGFLVLKEINGFLFFKEFKSLRDDDFQIVLSRLDALNKYEISNEKIKIAISMALLCSNFSNQEILSFLNRLTIQKNIIDNVVFFLTNKETIDLDDFSDFDIYILATKVNIENFALFLKAYHLNKKDKEIKELIKRAKKLNVLNKKAQSLIQGKDLIKLGLKPSKEFSKILNEAYMAQIKGKFTTYDEACEWVKKNLIKS